MGTKTVIYIIKDRLMCLVLLSHLPEPVITFHGLSIYLFSKEINILISINMNTQSKFLSYPKSTNKACSFLFVTNILIPIIYESIWLHFRCFYSYMMRNLQYLHFITKFSN